MSGTWVPRQAGSTSRLTSLPGAAVRNVLKGEEEEVEADHQRVLEAATAGPLEHQIPQSSERCLQLGPSERKTGAQPRSSPQPAATGGPPLINCSALPSAVAAVAAAEDNPSPAEVRIYFLLSFSSVFI